MMILIQNDARLKSSKSHSRVSKKSQNYELSRKMAVNAVALSGPGDEERVGSISVFIFHNNIYKKYCNIKKNDNEEWGNSKILSAILRLHLYSQKHRFVQSTKKHAVH